MKTTAMVTGSFLPLFFALAATGIPGRVHAADPVKLPSAATQQQFAQYIRPAANPPTPKPPAAPPTGVAPLPFGPGSSQTPIPRSTTPGRTCFDLVPKLTMGKALSAGTATITLQGKICNEGLYVKDYVTPPAAQAEGVFWEDMRYPPLTYAQMGTGSKFLARFNVNGLRAGLCQSMRHVVKIPGVVQWGNPPSVPRETRRVERTFSLVAGKATDQVFMAPSEECSNVNNDARVTVQYVVKGK